MIRSTLFLLVATALATGVSCDRVAAAERIAFVSQRSGNPDIWLMATDGGDATQLTGFHGRDLDPSWAPPAPGGAQRLAFASDRGGDLDIWSVRSDGSGLTQLTHGASDDTAPAWSPNGRRIAFMRTTEGNADIYVMRADGSRVRPVLASPGREVDPAWSPNGRWIVFSSNRRGTPQIYTVHADGTRLRSVTGEGVPRTHPSWFRFAPRSPAGGPVANVLVFEELTPTGETEVASASIERPGLETDLTRSARRDERPVWGSLGTSVVYESDRDGNAEIYSMDPSGRNQRRLTLDPADDLDPDVSGSAPPRSSRLAPKPRQRRAAVILCTRPVGTAGADRLAGSSGSDHLCGRGGGDVLWGDAGRDLLIGGPGDDWLYGGRGDDELIATDGSGGDHVIGGPGKDHAWVDPRDHWREVERVN